MSKIHVLACLLALPLIAPGAERQASPAASSQARQEVEATLSGFFRAAADADTERYFSHLAEDAVLIGTDASERWTTAELRTLLAPVFDAGEGLETVPVATHVSVSHDARLAWFDQRLESERWGEMRGSGVARRSGERWEIVQYVWSFPVPNELVPELSERFRALRGK